MGQSVEQPNAGGRWYPLKSFAGWQKRDFSGDFAGGLTLAAIAIPEQMATAKLAGFPPETGLYVFVVATIAFALFGASRVLSSGADSTIAPIFAGTLALVAAPGTAAYAGASTALALGVGVLIVVAGLARLGWVANFLSVPVTTGFLVGIAAHILVSQLPALLGVAVSGATLLDRVAALGAASSQSNPYAVLLGGSVFALAVAGEHFKWRVPGALIGVAASCAAVAWGHLEADKVAVVGADPLPLPHPAIPHLAASDLQTVASLCIVVTAVVMVQTAATTRAFASAAEPQDVDRDFIGVGAGSIAAGLFGLFPANASPPRTAAVIESGGRSQWTGLLASAIVVLLLAFGRGLLAYLPLSALAGILLAVALRLVRIPTIAKTFRETRAEFALILATAAAIVILPIQSGVVAGIALSILHGIWTITRTRIIEFVKVPGTSVWWPPSVDILGETMPHIRVVSFQAPLSFLNAETFRQGMIDIIEKESPRIIIFEASGVAEIDFTAAETLREIIMRCQQAHIVFAIARLTSLRAQRALARFEIMDALGPNGLFRSVDDALRALANVR